MTPHLSHFKTHESGIRRVVEAYFKYLPKYDIQFVKPDSKSYDIKAVHAGMTGGDCDVAHLHGLYWSADYPSNKWEHDANRRIVEALRAAKQVTVPSDWVAETIQRDMRFTPHVVPHGIEAKEWEHKEPNGGYVLWNKNRNIDVCSPMPVIELAKRFPKQDFKTTALPPEHDGLPKIDVIGMLPHKQMKKIICGAEVYLSTTKETFCIGAMEASAAGIPVLGFDWGGNSFLIEHGVTGYLAKPGNYDDLAQGLEYCIRYRKELGANAKEKAKEWKWDTIAEQVAGIYHLAAKPELPSVSVVIPAHNYGHVLERAVESALHQTLPPNRIIIVDDRSSDNTAEIGQKLMDKYDQVFYMRVDNGNVASTRNDGISVVTSKYIVCLDADDAIEERFLEACVHALEKDKFLGIAYTGLLAVTPEGEKVSPWPKEFDYDKQIKQRSSGSVRGMNQIPTCCMFRRKIWERLGGFNPQYAPLGAGAEDAEFWSRAGSIGFGARKISEAPMFIYSFTTGTVSGAKGKDINLIEPHWLQNKPWVQDGKHPFASIASTENNIAHLVRQYDEPQVSIIIPVGSTHHEIVRDAIESVEGQSFRNWELIVVFDGEEHQLESFWSGYPHIKVLFTGGQAGAGAARNMGAKIARGDYFVFLDADDELEPEFVDECLDALYLGKSIIYTDYYIKTYTEETDLRKNFLPNRIVKYTKDNQEAIISAQSQDYNCERAQNQPARDLYHWCLVTCLVPKDWHEAIGGFDENMESFEDVLYHWKLAKSGFCYTRVQENLVTYNMSTGTRRELTSVYNEEGLHFAREMLQYSKEELERMKTMPCTGCPGKKPRRNQQSYTTVSSQSTESVRDEDVVMVVYTSRNRGNHRVIGADSRKDYGYRVGGERFLVFKDDMRAQPHLFMEVRLQQDAMQHQDASVKPPPPPRETGEGSEKVVVEVFSLGSLPGVSVDIVHQMEANGIRTREDVMALGAKGLMEYKGIAESRADLIMKLLAEQG